LFNGILPWTVISFINRILGGIMRQTVVHFIGITRRWWPLGGHVYNDLGRRRDVVARTSWFRLGIVHSLDLCLTSIVVDSQVPSIV
jgi:hypothetical protein